LRAAFIRVALILSALLPLISTPAAAQAPDAGSAPIPAELRARWGILADLAGRDFYASGVRMMEMWQWSRPGRELSFLVGYPDGSAIYHVIALQDDGSLIMTAPIREPGLRIPVTLGADGSVTINRSADSLTHIERFVGRDLRVRGCIGPRQCSTITLRSVEDQSASVQSLARRFREENRIALANPPGESINSIASTQVTPQAGSPMPAAPSGSTSAPPDLRARWGILADLAGRDFCGGSCATEDLAMFRWREPGVSLELYAWTAAQRVRSVFRIGPSGSLEFFELARPNRTYPVALDAEGGIMIRHGSSGSRFTLRSGQLFVGFCLNNCRGAWSDRPFQPIDQAPQGARDLAARRRAEASVPLPTQAILQQVATTAAPATLPAPNSGGNASIVVQTSNGARVALVVGISTYGTLGNLTNPVNDARALAATLRMMGFDVDLVVDPDQRTLREAISRLGERMGRAGRGATGLFFFAGHGIQTRGTNYLIPAGARINREADVELEAVAADNVLTQMQEAGVSTNIIILDACRNMPLTRSFRNGSRGLAQMDAPNGTFIAYSTAPGSVAADGTGANSPFATALLREIVQPGQPIETVFRNVRRSVLRDTEGLQTPWDSSSLIDPFYFARNRRSGPRHNRAGGLAGPLLSAHILFGCTHSSAG